MIFCSKLKKNSLHNSHYVNQMGCHLIKNELNLKMSVSAASTGVHEFQNYLQDFIIKRNPLLRSLACNRQNINRVVPWDRSSPCRPQEGIGGHFFFLNGGGFLSHKVSKLDNHPQNIGQYQRLPISPEIKKNLSPQFPAFPLKQTFWVQIVAILRGVSSVPFGIPFRLPVLFYNRSSSPFIIYK